MFLITAFGRSGTHYTSRLLEAIGVAAPHEKLGQDGGVSWKHIASGMFLYLGKGRVEPIVDPGFDVIVHQVRDPLKVLSSSFTFSESTWHYMENHLGLTPEEDACRYSYFVKTAGEPVIQSDFRIKVNRNLSKLMGRQRDQKALVRRAMRCYIGWNELIEDRAIWRFRIEDLKSEWPDLLNKLGVDAAPMPELPKAAKDSRTDRSSYISLEWRDLCEADKTLADRICEMANRYGYKIK